MNIQLLLSANPSQGSGASASQATEAQGFPTGLFRQAMLQATDPQRPMGALSNAPSTGGEVHLPIYLDSCNWLLRLCSKN